MFPQLGALFEFVYKYSLLQMFYLNTQNIHFSTECITTGLEACGILSNCTNSEVRMCRKDMALLCAGHISEPRSKAVGSKMNIMRS